MSHLRRTAGNRHTILKTGKWTEWMEQWPCFLCNHCATGPPNSRKGFSTHCLYTLMNREWVIELRASESGREGIEDHYYFTETQTLHAQRKNITSITKVSCQKVKGKKPPLAQSELCLPLIGPGGRSWCCVCFRLQITAGTALNTSTEVCEEFR